MKKTGTERSSSKKQETALVRRRELLRLSATAAVVGSLPGRLAAQGAKGSRPMRTYTYKKVQGCEIKADVYGPAAAGSRRPVLLAVHGGALILGDRSQVYPEVLLDRILEQGFVVVSIDYRLAPETKLPEIIEDVKDAYRWIREKGPALFGADPDRIGVQGPSAGGYLTLMTGFCVQPPPRALVSYCGYGDIIGDWYRKPDPGYCRQPRVSKEVAFAAVGQGVPCGQPQGKHRHKFYLYCRQNGIWPRQVAGIDPETNLEAFKPFCPIQNVTPGYPPTLLCHGNKDADVPYEQSVNMAAELARVGVPYEFIPLQNVGHMFANSRPKDLDSALDRTIAFLAHYTRRAGEASSGDSRRGEHPAASPETVDPA